MAGYSSTTTKVCEPRSTYVIRLEWNDLDGLADNFNSSRLLSHPKLRFMVGYQKYKEQEVHYDAIAQTIEGIYHVNIFSPVALFHRTSKIFHKYSCFLENDYLN